MDLHPGEELVFEGHPSWRALLSFYVPATLGLLVLMLLYGFVKRMATVYMVSSQRLYIRKGILSKHVQQTRIDRVQNVNTSQSLLERILRVGTVDFDTAGTDDGDFRFIGISSPDDVVAAVDRAQREAAARL